MSPKPTRKRLAVTDAIDADHVRHYAFRKPYTMWDAPGVYSRVTDRVAELVAAGLAEIGLGEGQKPRPVRLTDAGRAWRAAAERTR